MRRLLSALLACVAIVTLCVGAVVMDTRPSLGAVECTWGQLKCCYSDVSCSGCCDKPKDDGIYDDGGLPAFARHALGSALRILAG